VGNLVNRASFGEHKEPTQREALLSEIRQAYHLGNWKHAKDLKRHYERMVKERKI
jgi:hypothetical protein